ncbi:MAG: bifunctional adenosylcobinamide kinase/adenosylcobinamide-phosphate guanylyltransferase [Anaerosomatales bacterium]|nr:bifunctional adenosylcobinamide kinase/adenosylcobinamide-phosphate guanylyltransferase [Anaerosomatales bacterium]GAV31207.1 adenosyl cobinamide kinase/adenosyl cobinamide phosphate guanylyltransferase [Coriobacteriaceae bacterium EMTCatB1]
MALTVITGGVRSGKSAAAAAFAEATRRPVVVVVAGVAEGDPEMAARIEAHRRARPAEWRVVEAAQMTPEHWLSSVSDKECLLVDCFGTLLASLVWPQHGLDVVDVDAREVTESALALADAIIARRGETIVVTNEVGWGVVPAYPSGRAFADAIGTANRRLVDAADRAFLAVCGRLVDLSRLPAVARMNSTREEE